MNTKIRIIYLIMIASFNFVACSDRITDSSSGNAERDVYNFTISYDYGTVDSSRDDFYRSKFDSTKLYLFIEENFENERIQVFVNEDKVIDDEVITESSTGLAEVYTIDDFRDIDVLGLKINNSPVICFEVPNKRMNLIGIEKYGQKVGVCFYKRTPSFY